MATQQSTISFCLTEISTVIKCVLGNLSGKQLCTAAKVCSSWRSMVDVIRRTRIKATAKVFKVEEDCLDDLERHITDYIHQVGILPQTAVCCAKESKYLYFEERHIAAMFENIYRSLPRDCNFIGCMTGGHVGEALNSPNLNDLESSDFGISGLLLLLPRIPNVNVTTFLLKHSRFRNMMKAKNPVLGDYADAFGNIEGKDVKVVVLYSCFNPRSMEKGAMALRKLFPGAIIIGGQVGSTQRGTDGTYNGITGFLISGNVTATSIVEKHGLPESFDTAMTALSDKVSSFQTSPKIELLITVMCVARGIECYGTKGVESGIIRQTFPNVPVFGMYAYGEVGHDRTVGASTCLPQDSYDGEYFHNFSTVVCYCGLG